MGSFPTGSAQPKASSLGADRLRQARVPALRGVGGAPDAPQGLHRSGGVVAASPTTRPSASAAVQPPQISVLSYRERPEVARAAVENIAAAFEDDPSTTYFCRPHQRAQFYRSVLGCLLDWYPEERQLVCTLPPDAAAFVYVYPRLHELGSWTKLLRGGLAPLGCVRLGRLVAGMDASDFFEGQREEFLKAHGPFMYVSVMAVALGRQGAGLGSSLLAFICDRADAAGLHCYIEATSPRNRALYERFGFQLVQAWRANPEMPYTYVLSRPPQPLEAESPVLSTPTAAASTADATVATATAATASSSLSPWWLQGGLQRRQRFEERRRQQRLRRQAGGAGGGNGNGGSVYDLDSVQIEVPYIDLDEYGWWPLRPSDAVAAGTAADDGEPASAVSAAEGAAEVPSGSGATTAAAAAGLFGGWASGVSSSSSGGNVGSAGAPQGGGVNGDSDSGGGGGGGWWGWASDSAAATFGDGGDSVPTEFWGGGDSDGGDGADFD